jgi:diguanylate cyclase (GGDEF)-like protein
MLRVWSETTLKALVMPGGILLLGVGVLLYSGWLTLALPALTFLHYSALIGGMLLAWRFHSSRIFFALLVLFLAGQALAFFSTGHLSPGTPAWRTVQAVALLVPLDFVLIAMMHERGFTVSAIAPIGLLLFVQSVIVAVLSRAAAGSPSSAHTRHAAGTISLPDYVLYTFAAAAVFLLVRFLLTRKPGDSALLWSLSSFLLALHFTGAARISTIYSATAACILMASIVENSYLLAYHDELTSLPSRRAFNDALLRLQAPYSIAVVDIDHFKRFNDTYGHDTGDQVLRLVAASLARVTGGGRAYRCGGEEFTILFPGKAISEVVDHLEQARATIESSEFRFRGNERRQTPRGPDRRNEITRSRVKKGHAIRQLAQEKRAVQSPLSVTVSIGVAAWTKQGSDPDVVLQSADEALYRAKAGGRNKVEVASSNRRPTRGKAAGIA